MTKLEKFYMIVGIILAGWWLFFYLPNSEKIWYGEGQVSLFPDGAESKNYRLTSPEIKAERKPNGMFSSAITYTIDQVDWPNGGYSDFHGCIVAQGKSASCTTTHGDVYTMEVTEAPSANN